MGPQRLLACTINNFYGLAALFALFSYASIMDIALPTKLYEEYREEGGPVRNRTNFTRPITQIIAIRDAMWAPICRPCMSNIPRT